MKKMLLSLMIMVAVLKAPTAKADSANETEAYIKNKLMALMLPGVPNTTSCSLGITQSWEHNFIGRFDIDNYVTLNLYFMNTLVWSSESLFIGGSDGRVGLPTNTVLAIVLQKLINPEGPKVRAELIQQLKTFGCL